MKSILKTKLKLSLILLSLLGSSLFVFQNCSRANFISRQEDQVINGAGSPFAPVAFTPKVDGVLPSDGLPLDGLTKDLSQQDPAAIEYANDCSAQLKVNGVLVDRKEHERQLSIQEVAVDPENLIPVQYALSFGDIEDEIATWAHSRAILSKSNVGESYIPVGPKGSAATTGFYKTNHDKAKLEFLKGQRCFFNTVKIKEYVASGAYFPFITGNKKHEVHYMYHGYCAGNQCATNMSSRYGQGAYGADQLPNRLFDKVPHNETIVTTNQTEPQFVKLYVADLRGKHMGRSLGSLLKIPDNYIRGSEKTLDIRDMIKLPILYANLPAVIRNLSSDYTSPEGVVFSALQGVPQLITNLFAGGTSLATQYTPIVLDLGLKKVRTSSPFGGTYFNMSASERSDLVNNDKLEVKHMTSWIGGELRNVKESADGLTYQYDYRRIADDGFLVRPDSDGKVRSSKNLFGDKTEVDGKTYENGFKALQALTKKDCLFKEKKSIYFGPWDTEAYNLIKVWVDANRNGESETSEIKSLAETGVLAINVCNIVDAESHDLYGNGTALRSAFLLKNEDDNGVISEEEILNRLNDGVTSAGKDAEFRLAIDLIFTSFEARTLEKYNLK